MSRPVTIPRYQQCITELHPDAVYSIPVLKGAPEFLVSERHQVNVYCTNRHIKYWSTWFLLKALTSSGDIKAWRAQKPFLLDFLQLGETTFYRQLKELQRMELLHVDRSHNIRLAEYKKGAEVMGITYNGLAHLPYNPIQNAGKQIFQYFIRAEEIRCNQQKQLDALVYYLDKNPLLRNTVFLALLQRGADGKRLLKDKIYLQERLLELQKASFRHGSNILAEIFSVRGDVNRSVRGIGGHHDYKHPTSVSYLKKRLYQLKLVSVNKVEVKSKVRSRIYITDPAAPGYKKDAYRWLPKQAATSWRLTDQINLTYEQMSAQQRLGLQKKAA